MAEQKDTLAELRRLAEAATPGPFDIERRDSAAGDILYIVHGGPKGSDVAWCRDGLNANARRHAEFLKRLDPATVLKLLAVVEAAKEMRDVWSQRPSRKAKFAARDKFDAALAALEGGEEGGGR